MGLVAAASDYLAFSLPGFDSPQVHNILLSDLTFIFSLI